MNDQYRKLGAFFAPRSLAQVKADIESLAAAVEFDKIGFKDSNFFYDRDRAIACFDFCQSMGKRVGFNLDITIRDVDESLFSSLECLPSEKQLFFGLESLIPEERERFNKPFSSDGMHTFFSMAQEKGYAFSGNLMFGFPFQTPETILSEVRMAVELMRQYPNLRINVSAYIPKHGTSMQEEHFAKVHEHLTFEELVKGYSSNIDVFQDRLYGPQFSRVRIEHLKRSFGMILALKTLYQHFPAHLRFILDGFRRVMEWHIRDGARNTLMNAILKRTNVIKFRRVLTRACTRYKKLIGAV